MSLVFQLPFYQAPATLSPVNLWWEQIVMLSYRVGWAGWDMGGCFGLVVLSPYSFLAGCNRKDVYCGWWLQVNHCIVASLSCVGSREFF